MAALHEQQVREVAIKYDARLGGDEQAQPGQAGRQLVDDEDAGREVLELASDPDVQHEVDLAQDGAENGEAAEKGSRDEPGALDADVEGTWGRMLVSFEGGGASWVQRDVPLRHSSKQWLGSQWFV